MSILRRTGRLTLALLAAVPGIGAARQADTGTVRKAAVTGVALGTVYVGAGRNDGLREGSLLRIPRLGERARYRVLHLSSRSAAAQGDSLAPTPVVGDSVEFRPAATAPTGTAAGIAVTGSRSRGAALRGRVGVRFVGSWDRASHVMLKQPGVELLLDGPLAPGAPVALSVDIRSRRTSLYRPGAATASRDVLGVYQAAVRFQSARGGPRAILGRQYAPTLAGVGLFDGLLLDWQKPAWGAGVTAGFSPELGSLAFSTSLRQAGLFLQARNSASHSLRFGLTLGGMGSYASGGINREFGFLQVTAGSRHLSALLLQEIDLNRGWKADAGEPRWSPTSSFLSLNLMPAQGVSLFGGLDNRRNVRLFRDLTTPEELFDDRFRRGVWGGAAFTIARTLRLGGDYRLATVEGADSLRTTAASVQLSADQLTRLGLGFRGRLTRYTAPGRGPGTLFAGGARLAPGQLGSLELNGGSRRESGSPESDRFWAGVETQILVRRSWFVLLTFTREWGRAGRTPTTDLLYGGMSYRF